MAYRERNTESKGGLVTVHEYASSAEAHLARARLADEGIEAHVFDEGLHNVIVTGAVRGMRLQVREGDLSRAAELLEEHPEADRGDDGEALGAVRCPRCELAYCFHERLRVEGESAATTLSFVLAPILHFLPRRWHCHKCGHVWDDAKEGPAEMTQLGPDDPSPVFRLRRAHAGMGLFVGLMVFAVGGIVVPGLPRSLAWVGALLLAAPLVGLLVGRKITFDVCSLPRCRTALPPDLEGCPRCNGFIAGTIRSADEHYAAAGDFRRELRALSREPSASKKKKAKRLPRG